jgi:CDGSH-type Zn-finger protein
MEKPMIADFIPVKASLEADKEYFYCTCGRSNSQPFCDGSHESTSFTPLAFTAKATTQKWFYACKHTKSAPNCDGSHQKFTTDDVRTIPKS